MNVNLKALSTISGLVGGIIILPYPIVGLPLIFLFLYLEYSGFLKSKHDNERNEKFNFEVAKSLVKTGGTNPYKEMLEKELQQSGRIDDIIAKYINIFNVDNSDHDALSNILIGYGVLLNHEITIYGNAQENTLAESKKYVSIAKKNFRVKSHLHSMLGLALIYDAAREFSKSNKIYSKLLEKEPNNISVINSYGMSLLMSGKIQQANILLDKTITEKNFSFLTLYNVGACRAALGHFSVSNFYLGMSYRLSKKWKTLAVISRNHFLMGNFKEAFFTRIVCNFYGGKEEVGAYKIAFFDLLMSILYGFYLTLSFTVGRIPYLGRIYFKKFTPARQFEEIIQVHIDNFPDAFNQSITLIDKLLLIDPENETLLYNLVILNAKIGDKNSMLKHFERLPQTERMLELKSNLSKLNEKELRAISLVSEEGDRSNFL